MIKIKIGEIAVGQRKVGESESIVTIENCRIVPIFTLIEQEPWEDFPQPQRNGV